MKLIRKLVNRVFGYRVLVLWMDGDNWTWHNHYALVWDDAMGWMSCYPRTAQVSIYSPLMGKMLARRAGSLQLR